MGLIRKTLSISTLGLVSWRSKKELLAEAEAELAQTRADLERTSTVERLLREKLDDAEHRATAAELTALRDARRARRRGARTERAKFPRRKRLTAAAGSAIKPMVGLARDTAERIVTDAEPVIDDAADKARASSRRARKKLAKRAKKTEKRARKKAEQLEAKARARAEKLEAKARDRAERLRDDASDAVVDLRERAEDAADTVSERAKDLTSR